ncbi:MAG: DnaJ domain-containing protein [Cyanobacteria bacterium J06639_1]
MTHYQLLQISPRATPEQIKQAYRRLARKYHPDVAGEENRDRFLKINEAYQVLRNPLQRREYDRTLNPKKRVSSPTSSPKSSQATASASSFTPFEFDVETYTLMKQRVRSAYERKEYAIAVKLADELALRFTGHPTAQRWVALSYHQRGRELLRFKQFKLAQIYLNKALAAQSRDKTLLDAIRKDLVLSSRI